MITALACRSSSQSIKRDPRKCALRVAPEFADPVGPREVGEHQDMEQLGAGNGAT
jgi:hypothetical protein